MSFEPPQEPTVNDVMRYIARNFDKIDVERLAYSMTYAARDITRNDEKASTFVSRHIRENTSFAMLMVESRVFCVEHAPKIIGEMVGGNKVPAVKLIRQGYRLGLKEAKDIADYLQDELFLRERVPTAYNCKASFDGASKLAIEELMEHIDG